MIAFLLRRVVVRAALLLAASAMIFLIVRPLTPEAAPAVPLPSVVVDLLARGQAMLGIDTGLLRDFAGWLNGILHGDLGTSAAANVAMADLLARRLPVTLQLLAMTLVVALPLALPLGILAGRSKGGRIDRLTRGLAVLGESAPLAGIALIFVLIFAVVMRALPEAGYVPLSTDMVMSTQLMLMPAAALALGTTAALLRVVREATRDATRDGHLVVARAFGASDGGMFWGRTLRFALATILAAAPALLGQLLAGTVLVEAIFDLPGIGRLVIESLIARDFALLRQVAIAAVAAIVVLGLAGDVLRGLLDRRVRTGARA